ncbi:putative disease resistance RPP13-like protein 1 [Aristolochia californica]|uniref:putative disease resistance RPP13-like protein 1 n=1 Tax=Aristolochia californica TaxID=171875 RepID=UPI0035E269D5
MGFKKRFMKLNRYLLGVQPLLKDAEIQQFTDESVRSWVTNLTGLAYDMEDIVDEMNTQILQLQIESNRNIAHQVLGLLTSHHRFNFIARVKYFTINNQITSKLNEVLKENRIAHKIDEVLKRWEEIVAYGNLLQLREHIGGRTLEDIKKRRETTSISYENHVFGRDYDLKEISALLKSDQESNEENVSVIVIVAMCGSGKTTLTKLVYNDHGVEFHAKAWVYVSYEFDCKKVTKSIVESLQNGRCDLSNLDQMQRCLRRLVEGKKYLIVLDDAWTKNPDDWDCLMAPLRGGKGSMIIVTSPSEKVSKSLGVTMTYKLKGLSNDDCWAIVKKKAFGNNDTNESQKVEDTKMDVISKCKGLPLVANVLGGFLCTIEIDNWGRLLKSELWDFPKTKDNILPTLILSYLFLSPYLKRCFTYCVLFPKGFLFRKEEIVLEWMAQGFLEGNRCHELEDIGNNYFDDLVARHFLQLSSLDCYVVHVLNHDLAQLLMGNISFSRVEEEIREPAEETRYMFLDSDLSDENQLEQFFRAKGVHTLWAKNLKSVVELNDLIQNFERLRVLRFNLTEIDELPKSIGNLKHLRFLYLSNMRLKSLPDSICSLYNLQTLNVSRCDKLVKLPEDMGNLINLRHLLLLSCSQFRELPDSISWKDNKFEADVLEALEPVYVKLEFLTITNYCGFKLKMDGQPMLVNCPNLMFLPKGLLNKSKLEKLVVEDCPQLEITLEELTFLTELRELVLENCYKLVSLPEGLPDTLSELIICHCPNLSCLPKGLPNMSRLKKLVVEDCPLLVIAPEEITILSRLPHFN